MNFIVIFLVRTMIKYLYRYGFTGLHVEGAPLFFRLPYSVTRNGAGNNEQDSRYMKSRVFCRIFDEYVVWIKAKNSLFPLHPDCVDCRELGGYLPWSYGSTTYSVSSLSTSSSL